AEQVASVHPAFASLMDGVQAGRWIRGSKPERPMRPMHVVMLDVDAQHPLQVAASYDQQQVQALSADRADPTLCKRVGVRRLDRRQDDLGTLGPEEIVESSAELGVPIAENIVHAASLLAQHQQQIPRLLGDPGAIGVGGDPGQVNPSGVQFDEEQHVQPFEPHGVDGEEVAGEDPGGLLTQKRPPGRTRAPRGRVEAVAAQRFADRGGRDLYAEVEQLTLDPLVAPGGVLGGQTDDQLLDLRVERGTPASTMRVGPGAGDQPAVPAQQRLRLDQEHDQRARGSRRLIAASRARSAGSNLGRGTWRRSTASWWRRTSSSRSLAASPRGSRAHSWMVWHSMREGGLGGARGG